MKTFSSGQINKATKVYVGIDQSYTGFAMTALSLDGSYHTEVYKSELRGIRRLKDIRHFMIDFLDNFQVVDIAMEGYAFGSQMANMLGELGGMVKLALLDYNYLFPMIVPPTSLKKYACGKGNGVSKSQILLHVYKNFNAEFTDDNAADSYVLAHLVSGMGTRKYEKEVYAKLSSPDYRER